MEAPTRTCLACRQRSAKPSLIRLAVVDGRVQVDPFAIIQSRGTYICAGAGCTEIALQREGAAIARALRMAPGAVDITTLRARLAEQMSSATQDDVAAQLSRGVCT